VARQANCFSNFVVFDSNKVISAAMSPRKLVFLKGLKFKHKRPSSFYYYRELQNLRDLLHFPEGSVVFMHKRRDAGELEKQLQLDARKTAIQRWIKNRNRVKSEKNSGRLARTTSRGGGGPM